MPIDYVPSPSAYYSNYQKKTYVSSSLEYSSANDFELESLEDEEFLIPQMNLLKKEIPSLTASIESDLKQNFTAQAIWGPVEARLIPETKRTLSKVISNNIADLTEQEYLHVRELLIYVLSNPESKQRVFELTGFEEKDIAFAEKYFRKFKRKFFFTKLVEIALATSSNGNVSKQIGGLIQFIFETAELNNERIPDQYKFKFIRGIPELIQPIWNEIAEDCALNPTRCTQNYTPFMDLNQDQKIDEKDVKIAIDSMNWLMGNVNSDSSF
ncbi:MAG: hypothetical protein QNJ31_03140 [Candidatus Caenarcaniphilales bacterium]|nr:hypothetical protein [Candidatus Caenarcaniphilales bacterium]